MSATGLDVFDRTLQTTHIWLGEIMEAAHTDRHVAWHALGTVLRTLRDRIPIELAAHLGSELPLLVRGVYYDQWRPGAPQKTFRTAEQFLEHVAEGLASTRPLDPRKATHVVLAVLSRHLAAGQVEKARHALPDEIRALWPAPGTAAAELDLPAPDEDAEASPGRDV